MMHRQLTQMVRLIDDLMDVSRITSGKVSLRKERVSLRAVAESALETSRSIIDASGHTLRVNLPEQPVWLTADLTRLSQVVGNLLTNAAKYTPEGGNIELEAVLEGGEVVIRVADTGLGIPPGMLDEVFAMFTQVNRTLDRSQGGLGIGLALVKRIVELHGGTITAESPGLGKGSTFTVRLPVVEAGLDGAEPATRLESWSGESPISRRRVLVVDDNKDGANSLAVLIEMSGHEIRIAHDGPEALDAARQFKPEVVFLDIGLPTHGRLRGRQTHARATVRRRRHPRRPHRLGERGPQAAIEGGRFRFSPDEAGRDHGYRRDPGSVRRCRAMRNESPGEAMQEAAMLKMRVILEHFLDLLCRLLSRLIWAVIGLVLRDGPHARRAEDCAGPGGRACTAACLTRHRPGANLPPRD